MEELTQILVKIKEEMTAEERANQGNKFENDYLRGWRKGYTLALDIILKLIEELKNENHQK